jgi:hypothetical protein
VCRLLAVSLLGRSKSKGKGRGRGRGRKAERRDLQEERWVRRRRAALSPDWLTLCAPVRVTAIHRRHECSTCAGDKHAQQQ